MRKIEQDMVEAVDARKNWRSGNTEVCFDNLDGTGEVYLHGNLIATVSPNGRASPNGAMFARWPTRTTSSRLGALGVHCSIRKGVAYIGDDPAR